ncbi:MAG: ATP-binding protein, partial [Thermodesulfobacteriota bacterium]|nr:ATP-binding protein [Thermodesulfobacteriota bacterium]
GLLSTYPLFDEKGKMYAALGVSFDLSEKQKLEHQLRQAQKMESVGRLAGGVAHDFNNMLSIIIGNTELMLDDMDEGSRCIHNLKEIRNAANRSADLTRQLLAFARQQTIAPKVLDLNVTVEGMLKMLRRLIGEDIELIWLPFNDLWKVNVDPSQVDQILANLCVNARDSIKGVGKIIIETVNIAFDEEYCRDHDGFMPGNFAVIIVSDDGCGMEKKMVDKIFEPFFTTKEMGQGTGLGLSTVYGIVKQNDGFINVYSEPDKGSTFKIYLPRHIEKPPKESEQRLEKRVLGGDETILLVEDEQEILRMTTIILERLGYKVLPAGSPIEAIHKCESYYGNIDMILTDVVMPDMSGRDLVKKLLRLYPNIKCLYMSGYTANVIAHHGVLDEGIQFINKPFSIADLAAKIRRVLDMNQSMSKEHE